MPFIHSAGRFVVLLCKKSVINLLYKRTRPIWMLIRIHILCATAAAGQPDTQAGIRAAQQERYGRWNLNEQWVLHRTPSD